MESYNQGAMNWSNRILKAKLYRELEGIPEVISKEVN
jgi:hypothetical protein